MLRLVCSLVLIALTVGCQSPDSSSQLSPSPTSSSPGRSAVVGTTAFRPAAADRAERTLQFSGYTWHVKASPEPVGPGPNAFADGPENVWIDAAGRLHLRITYQAGRWWAAEVISTRSFGYGTYRFVLDTNVDELDPQVVLGLFTWSDDSAFSHREIDIEISRWGQEDNENAQCVLQPYQRPHNIARFAVPRGLPASIHSFTWAPNRVVCQSLRGSDALPAPAAALIHEHTFTDAIPVPGGENARINLWLLGGRAPAYDREVEVVIHRFMFVPL